MEIKVYGEIMNEEEKQFRTMFFDNVRGLTYFDINDILAGRDKDDNEITLRINCPGGSCIDGFAIYDRLRATEGAEISAIVEGECSSMATIVLLAAKAENRRAYANTRFCVHKSRIMEYYGQDVTDDDAQKLADELRAETDRLVRVYVDRTTADEQTIRDLMERDTYITADEAKGLGLIAEIIQPVSATKTKRNEMNAIQRLVVSMAKAVGLTDLKDTETKAVMLNTADGGELEIDIEEGAEPQVGDAARPDGEHLMQDGKTIVVVDGVITEIRMPENETNEPEPEPEQDAEGEGDPMEQGEDVEQLKAENEQLKAENEQLKATVDELRARIEELEQAEPTTEDKEILDTVAKCGGVEWLKSVKSNYKPQARQTKSQTAGQSKLQQELAKAGIKSHQN